MRVAFLGPAGTYSEDALRHATAGEVFEAAPMPPIHAAVMALD